MKIKYSGTANGIPKHNLTFQDGDVLDVDEGLAKQLVEENIGFTYAEEPKAREEKPRKKKGDMSDG
jgi:ABC-type uncharacterized transport system permease subunit